MSEKKAEGSKALRTGVVDAAGRDKTRRVLVPFTQKHPKYGKYRRRTTAHHVHDERNESGVGDVVEIAPCRPVSKTKSWRLVRIVEKRSQA